MASAVQKFLRQSPAKSLIAALRNHTSPYLAEPFASYRQNLETKPESYLVQLPSSSATSSKEDDFPQHSLIFPSLPLGYCLSPISSAVPAEVEDMAIDDSRRMWADSVKKKRKRKMNKHKYKKLRKRLRRQT